MRDYRELVVWQKAHRLVIDVYQLTKGFPDDERFGLTAQLRRASASIPTNIAEGSGRDGDREYARFVSIATGSASETEYQLLLAHDLGYLDEETYRKVQEQVAEVKRMLSGFLKKLSAGG